MSDDLDKLQEQADIEQGMKDMREGRTYPYRCQHAPANTHLVCHNCVVEACDRWYELGKADARKERI